MREGYLQVIPFRTQSIVDAIDMYALHFDPLRYTFLRMRENSYLVFLLPMAGFLLVWLAHRAYLSLVAHSRRNVFALEWGVIAVASGFVFVFLRPVSRFIYFQF